jgi:hypothetical protein
MVVELDESRKDGRARIDDLRCGKSGGQRCGVIRHRHDGIPIDINGALCEDGESLIHRDHAAVQNDFQGQPP